MSDNMPDNAKIKGLVKNALVVSGVVTVVGVATLLNQKVAETTAEAAAQVVAQTAAQTSTPSSSQAVNQSLTQAEIDLNNEIRALLDNTNIYDNIFIQDIDMSNVSTDDAKDMLAEALPMKSNIILTYGETEFEISADEIGLYYGINNAVNEAFNVAREGTDEARLLTLEKLETDNANFYVELNYDTSLIKSKLDEIAKKVYVAYKEPSITKSVSTFSMSGGSNGIYMDVDATFNDIMSIIEDPYLNEIAITTVVTYPKTTQESVNKMGDVLGTFTTNFSNDGSGRVTNIKLASNNINGVTIAPGGTFSTNAEFGPTTAANGFQLGGAYLNGEVVQSYGGGVCQVSSTLYMAVLHSELQIVERQNHSMPVGYIGYGYDATLAGTYIDLKFKNNTNAPIYVESYINSGNQVVCTIYGYDERSASRSIKFENTLTSNTDTGFTYQVHKLIYENGQYVDKVHINTSYYKKTAGSYHPTTAGASGGSITPSANQTTTQVTTEHISEATTQVFSAEPITEATTQVITQIPFEEIVSQTQQVIQDEVPLEDLTLISFDDLIIQSTTQQVIITEPATQATTQLIITQAPTEATTQQIFTESPIITTIETIIETTIETTTQQIFTEPPTEATTQQAFIEMPIITTIETTTQPTTQQVIEVVTPSIPDGIPAISDMLESAEDDEVI